MERKQQQKGYPKRTDQQARDLLRVWVAQEENLPGYQRYPSREAKLYYAAQGIPHPYWKNAWVSTTPIVPPNNKKNTHTCL